MKNEDIFADDGTLENQSPSDITEDIGHSDSVINDTDAMSPQENEDDLSSLNSLLYEDEGEPYEPETTEESIAFEDFLTEYKAHISKRVNFGSSETQEAKTSEVESTVKDSSPEFKETFDTEAEVKKHEGEETGWSDEITLAPEIYEAPDEDENIFRDTPMPEEEPEEETFSIGTELYHTEEDEIQISIKFDESSVEKPSTDASHTEYKYSPDKPRIIDNIFDFIELFTITLVCVMILTTFIFRHSVVEGASMQNTLSDGDSLIITNLFYKPKRGDIIVFEDYSTSLKKAVVKRVIGLPGEKVEVKVNKNKEYEVYINDELLPEEYAYNDPDYSAPSTGVWYIEEGEVFVMGDNRYNSTDSRNSGVGPIDIECILGKVVLRFYPFDKFGKVD